MAGEDRPYLAWVGSKLCATKCGRTSGPPHHPRHAPLGGGVGLALKAHDRRAVNLCHQCHVDIHSLSGFFRGWRKQELRDWLDEVARDLQKQYDRQQGVDQ
jgi:hypothetical protein